MVRRVVDGSSPQRALQVAPGQTVIAHSPDRNLSVDEIGGIQLVEDAAVTEAQV